jgi:uncharacterized protein (DUF2141 family)
VGAVARYHRAGRQLPFERGHREDGTFVTRFSAVPEGDYAVVVVHDANDNEQLDTGLLGFNSEAYGYSNNVHPWFGRPSFEDVKFSAGAEEVVVEIDLD